MAERIAILGGTGEEGFGLALRWAQAGVKVSIGSRSAEKAQLAVQRLRQSVPQAVAEGCLNVDAAAAAAVTVLAVPLSAQPAIIREVRDRLQPGSVLVDTTVPLERSVGGRLSRMLSLWDGSAAQQAARVLNREDVAVACAFHAVSAHSLQDLGQEVHSDILIAGQTAAARDRVAELVRLIPGANPIDLGSLDNARYAEHLAATLIALNLKHKVRSSGVRFTGLYPLDGGG